MHGITSALQSAVYKSNGKSVAFCRKNVPDYSASRTMNDLGFVSFDLLAGTDMFSNTYLNLF